MTHNNFAIRTYGKSEFDLLMFPTIDDPKVAQGFRHRTPEITSPPYPRVPPIPYIKDGS